MKRSIPLRLCVCLLPALVLAGPGPAGAIADAQVNPRYWADVQTGLAIGGYDPLSYFVDGEPRPGKAAFEASWGGATWRFSNEGNRAAFLDAPEVYAPRFGGYSPSGVADGAAVRGNPLIWTIFEDRLYLFHSPLHKLLWDQDRDGVLKAAKAAWPEVLRTLTR